MADLFPSESPGLLNPPNWPDTTPGLSHQKPLLSSTDDSGQILQGNSSWSTADMLHESRQLNQDSGFTQSVNNFLEVPDIPVASHDGITIGHASHDDSTAWKVPDGTALELQGNQEIANTHGIGQSRNMDDEAGHLTVPVDDASAITSQTPAQYQTSSKTDHVCIYQSCDTHFHRVQDLKRHHRTVHIGNRSYFCRFPDCKQSQVGFGFKRRDNLRDHERNVHGLESEDSDEEK